MTDRVAAARRTLTGISTLFVVLSLVACGGGGGGGGPPPGLTMTLSTTSLTFTSTDGGTPIGQSVTATFSGTASGTLYILIVPTNPALVSIGDITTTGTSSGQATVTPASTTMVAAGSNTTTIQVFACLNDSTCKTGQVNGSPQSINVTYNVDGITASVANLAFAIGNSPATADYTQTFSVTGYPTTQNWTSLVSSTTPWLSLTPSTGSTAGAVSVSATLDQTQVNALANGTYTGQVFLTPTNGNQVTLPVTLTIARTKVNFVAPYVATSGTSDSVIIRGEHFELLAQPISIKFGTTMAASASFVSATEIHASYPVLQAGRYPVQLIANGQASGVSRATLVVVDPPTFPAAKIAYPTGNALTVQGLAYDAERRAVLAQVVFDNSPSPTTYSLVRVGYGSGVWGAPVLAPLTQASAFTLSLDGTQVLAAYNDASSSDLGVTPLDPTTLVMSAPLTTGFAGFDYGAYSMGVANDGQAIIAAAPFITSDNLPVIAYSELQPALTSLQFASAPPVNAVVGASGDGASVFLASNSTGYPGFPPVSRYDASSGQLLATASSVQSTSISVDRHGTRVILNAKDVYDASITLLGSLPTTTVGSTVSADAKRAYSYDSNGTVRVFDLTAAPMNSLYPEIMPSKTLISSPAVSVWAMLAVSPDGGSLFVAIESGIYVVPLP